MAVEQQKKPNLAETLSMSHLRPTEDLVKETEAAVAEAAKPQKEVKDPRTQREYTFPFKHVMGSGKILEGEFTSKILSLGEQQLVGILRARLSGNTDYLALDEYTKELNLMVAHLTYSLKERPEWAKDLRELDDISILQALYMEVAQHEAIFRGERKTEDGGKEKR